MYRITALACALLLGCGGSTEAHDTTNDAATGTPTMNAVGGYTLICDGSANVRLAIRVGGGGQVSAGNAMLSENGWQYLVVDGTCHAWLLTATNEPLRDLHLSHDQERDLSRALRLWEWSSFTTQHQGGCSDAPSMSYRLYKQRLTVPACGLPKEDPFSGINAAFQAQLEQLSAVATAVAGDVRYLVVAGESPNDQRKPALWPLTIPLESVWSSDALQLMPGQSQRATGDDAAKLRAIRTTKSNGSAGFGSYYSSTPVTSAAGAPAALYLRDSSPFEGDDGLITGNVF